MKKEENKTDGAALRRLAEAAVEASPDDRFDLSGISPEGMESLIHELRVHQIELTMQNKELRNIQAELEKARDRYSHLYDFSPVGYLTVNEKGIIEEANLTAATMLGVERSLLVGSPFSRFILGEDQDIFYLHRRQLLETEKPQSCRLRLVKKDGSAFFADMECIVAENEAGGEKQIRMTVSDISEQKDLENQLLQSRKMEAIGTLAGGIAHDFNNILAAVIGFTELALDDAEKGSSLARNLEEVLIGGKRAKLLVQQILMFSRKSPPKWFPVRLDALVQEAVRLLRATLPADIEMAVEIKTAMDPCVMGDETQIHQILLNLCSNAAHAMEARGGKITIGIDDIFFDAAEAKRMGMLASGRYINLSVGDTGEGMTPDIVGRIFEPYFTTKEQGKGTGMGLAVVEGIVTAHKGHILAMSQPQKGTIFNVFLPLPEKVEKPESMPADVVPGGNEHVLFVEDELPIAKLNKMILEKLGYDVTVSTSSPEALELFRAAPQTFDLVITDMTMPHLTGDKLAAELLKIRPDIPIILCTGYSRKVSEELASGIGIKAFAYKPVNKAEMAKIIRTVLDAGYESSSVQKESEI